MPLENKLTIILCSCLILLPQLSAVDKTSLEDWGVTNPHTTPCVPVELTHAESKLLTNVASKAFTWLTGSVEQARYEPVGELANYFGFAKLRNEIRDSSDNSLADENLRGSSWIVVLENLDKAQREILYKLAEDQSPYFFGFLDARLELINGLYELKEGNPLNLEELNSFVSTMGTCEAQISLLASESYGEVSSLLTDEQREIFTQIRKGQLTIVEYKGKGPWASEVQKEMSLFDDNKTDLMTEVASKLLSYETGSLEDAVFLPSGKIGNFFGFASYRYEDRAKVSRSQAAEALLNILTEEQIDILESLTKQIYPLEQSYIEGRAQLIRGAYPLKLGTEVNQEELVDLYLVGALSEGRMGITQAVYFDLLEQTLTDEQREELANLRVTSSETPGSSKKKSSGGH